MTISGFELDHLQWRQMPPSWLIQISCLVAIWLSWEIPAVGSHAPLLALFDGLWLLHKKPYGIPVRRVHQMRALSFSILTENMQKRSMIKGTNYVSFECRR